MKTLPLLVALGIISLAADLSAREPGRVQQASTNPTDLQVISPGEVTATPEMWFYEQELRRYEDPKYAIRARAEQKSAQRLARIAAMKWYGLSNSRPRANPDPVHGVYSPQWISNGYSPFQWPGPSNSTIIVDVPRSTSRD